MEFKAHANQCALPGRGCAATERTSCLPCRYCAQRLSRWLLCEVSSLSADGSEDAGNLAADASRGPPSDPGFPLTFLLQPTVGGCGMEGLPLLLDVVWRVSHCWWMLYEGSPTVGGQDVLWRVSRILPHPPFKVKRWNNRPVPRTG